jgi:hypothetical protein
MDDRDLSGEECSPLEVRDQAAGVLAAPTQPRQSGVISIIPSQAIPPFAADCFSFCAESF